MSTTAKRDSIDISRTIGTASKRTARPTGTSVKSSCDPRMASRTVAQNPADTFEIGCAFGASFMDDGAYRSNAGAREHARGEAAERAFALDDLDEPAAGLVGHRAL